MAYFIWAARDIHILLLFDLQLLWEGCTYICVGVGHPLLGDELHTHHINTCGYLHHAKKCWSLVRPSTRSSLYYLGVHLPDTVLDHLFDVLDSDSSYFGLWKCCRFWVVGPTQTLHQREHQVHHIHSRTGGHLHSLHNREQHCRRIRTFNILQGYRQLLRSAPNHSVTGILIGISAEGLDENIRSRKTDQIPLLQDVLLRIGTQRCQACFRRASGKNPTNERAQVWEHRNGALHIVIDGDYTGWHCKEHQR